MGLLTQAFSSGDANLNQVSSTRRDSPLADAFATGGARQRKRQCAGSWATAVCTHRSPRHHDESIRWACQPWPDRLRPNRFNPMDHRGLLRPSKHRCPSPNSGSPSPVARHRHSVRRGISKHESPVHIWAVGRRLASSTPWREKKESLA